MTLEAAPETHARRRRGSHRGDIQGLRALAVLLVILNHAGIDGFRAGFVGVDVFFVVSGYVITGLLLDETAKGTRAGLSDFYARRIRRIVPAATVTLVATVLVAYLTLGRQLNPDLPGDVRWASLFSSNFRLIDTGSNYFVPGLHPSLITQFWSLAVEEQFYLFFPLVVFAVARFAPPSRRLPLLAGVLGAAVALSAWWSAQSSAAHPVTAYYSPATRFWELGLGCLLATLPTGRRARRDTSDRLAGAAGALLIVAALIAIGPGRAYPGMLAWLPCLGAALLLWAGRDGGRNPVTRALSVPLARRIGDMSYSLYLFHFVWLYLPAQLGHPLTGGLWRVLEIAGTFATSALCLRFVENPLRHSERLARDPISSWLLLAVCIAAVWAAAAVVGQRLDV